MSPALAEPDAGPRIWVVNADQWPRAYLRAELIERGYDAVGFEALNHAVARLVLAPTLRPAALVVDLHGKPVDEKLRAFLFQRSIPVVSVHGAAEPRGAPLSRRALVLRRPLTLGAIADAVARLVPSPSRVATFSREA